MTPALAAEFVLLAALWGSSFLFMLLGAAEFGAWATAGLRVAIASLVLVPILFWAGHWPTLRQHARAILLIGLVNSAIPFALYAYALLHISTGVSAILNATTPLFGALVAWVWLKDVPGPARAIGHAQGLELLLQPPRRPPRPELELLAALARAQPHATQQLDGQAVGLAGFDQQLSAPDRQRVHARP